MKVEPGFPVSPPFDPNLRSGAAGLELRRCKCVVERRPRGRTSGFHLQNVDFLELLEAFTLKVMIWASLPSLSSPA